MNVSRYVCTVSVALVATGGFCIWMVGNTAQSKWDEMTTWAGAQRQIWEQRSFARPVLFGETHEGNAWDDYSTALKYARLNADTDDLALAKLATGAADPDGDAGRELRARWRESIDYVRMGAHRGQAQPEFDWDTALGNHTMQLADTRTLLNAVSAEACAAIDTGDDIGGVATLLDACRFAADTARRPLLIDEVIGYTILDMTLQRVPTPSRVAKLSHQALELLGNGLEELDDDFPATVQSLQIERALLAQQLVGASGIETLSDFNADATSMWRFGFSQKLMVASAVLGLAAIDRDLALHADEGWPARQTRLEAAANEIESWNNPLAEGIGVKSKDLEVQKRAAVARVRLLRMEVEWRLRGDATPLPDPLGGTPLKFAPAASGGATFSSESQGFHERVERTAAHR